MKIDLDQIGQDGLDVSELLTTEWLEEALGAGSLYHPAACGYVNAHLAMLDDTVHVSGRAAAALEAPCSRCTRPARLAMDVPLQVAMVPSTRQPQPAADGEINSEDVGLSIYVGRQIDLTAIIRDELMLELPMRALCHEACAGLCAQCGANLNESKCTCMPQFQSPLHALRNIKLH